MPSAASGEISLGGYTDWYMPAKNELEVLYYNLKPNISANAGASGINTNAVPIRVSIYESYPYSFSPNITS